MKRKAVFLSVIVLLVAFGGSIFGQPRIFAGAPDKTAKPETADVKEEFLRWRLTTNQNDRWTIYHAAMDEIMASALPPEANYEDPAAAASPVDSGAVSPGVSAAASELEEAARQAIDSYYSGIAGIASEELIEKMALNRTPMRDDELYLNYGASMEFAYVVFGEGRKDSFASGMIYDFDACVTVEGYENIPKFPYTPDEEGYFHRTGQITEEGGLVTNIYFAENR